MAGQGAHALQCTVCGGTGFERRGILWQKLIDEWQLAPDEAEYVERQQGECCVACGANLRSIALARALLTAFDSSQTLEAFCASADAARFRVLELNEAGNLHGVLSRMPNHVFGTYPEVDMHALPYPDASFDVVTHSDTLEHVPDPVHALGECRRVLKPGGALCFTVPMVVGRLTRSRAGLAKSYHGNPNECPEDLVVHTEFGADAWTCVMQAGFDDVRLYGVEYPASVAIAARRR